MAEEGTLVVATIPQQQATVLVDRMNNPLPAATEAPAVDTTRTTQVEANYEELWEEEQEEVMNQAPLVILDLLGIHQEFNSETGQLRLASMALLLRQRGEIDFDDMMRCQVNRLRVVREALDIQLVAGLQVRDRHLGWE